ncbi:MAG: aminodeoxychorismate/anthranilate synthase component II [Bdellovibrionales bacterium]|nr:aminodeoxychorismate/anthranilate synthase component II [Bdellovibrionales bacterium]
MKKILVVDNFDSFTFNLVHLLREFEGISVLVRRNNVVEPREAEQADGVVLSPGPGLPKEAGRMPEIVRSFQGKIPFLGVCLGHQAIAEACGAKLKNLDQVMHGVESEIRILDSQDPLYRDVPEVITVGRYHSWVVDPDTLPSCLTVTAIDDSENIMSFRHNEDSLFGVQYHPESIMTPLGAGVLNSWLQSEVFSR